MAAEAVAPRMPFTVRDGAYHASPGAVRRAPVHGDASACIVGRPPRATQRGYTLIEVLVAFAVLALALTVLLGALSGGTRQVRWAADAGRAALHAQSLLADTGIGVALEPGRSDGVFEDGRYRWSLEIAPWVDPALPPVTVADPFAPSLLSLQLTVSWGEGGPRERLQLQTLRLVQPDGLDGVIP